MLSPSSYLMCPCFLLPTNSSVVCLQPQCFAQHSMLRTTLNASHNTQCLAQHSMLRTTFLLTPVMPELLRGYKNLFGTTQRVNSFTLNVPKARIPLKKRGLSVGFVLRFSRCWQVQDFSSNFLKYIYT